MKRRRLKRHAAHLEITAFINLIVVLVPFLLSTAVFSRIAVMELKLPAPSTAEGPLAADDLKLEVKPAAGDVGNFVIKLNQRSGPMPQEVDVDLAHTGEVSSPRPCRKDGVTWASA